MRNEQYFCNIISAQPAVAIVLYDAAKSTGNCFSIALMILSLILCFMKGCKTRSEGCCLYFTRNPQQNTCRALGSGKIVTIFRIFMTVIKISSSFSSWCILRCVFSHSFIPYNILCLFFHCSRFISWSFTDSPSSFISLSFFSLSFELVHRHPVRFDFLNWKFSPSQGISKLAHSMKE